MYQYWAGKCSSFTKSARTLTIFIILHGSDVILNDKPSYYVALFFICRFKCVFGDIRENANTVFVPIFGSFVLFPTGCAPIFGNANTGYSFIQNQKCVIVSVSERAHSIDLSKIKIFLVPIFGSLESE